jgi:hypothetical protein
MSANPYDSQEYIDYVRENINPAYKLSKKEALKYAASMGTTDTLRGIGQLVGAGLEQLGVDELTEYLKQYDKKLSGILSNPEYGTEATAAFLSAGIVADPVSYVPIVGWMAKGKKAKSLADLTKYGAGSAAIVSGLGYTPEDTETLFLDKDAGLLARRLENIGIGGVAGTILGGGGGYLVDTIQKARGKPSIFQQIDEFEPKVFDDTKVSAEDLDAPLKVGTTIRAPDRQNLGTIIAIDEKTNVATVRFTNRKTGATATKRFPIAKLRPPKPGQSTPKTTEDLSEEVAEKYDDIIFTKDPKSVKGNIVYTTTDPETKIVYTISKAVDEQGNIIKGQWEVISDLNEVNPLKRRRNETRGQFRDRKRKNIQTNVFGNKEDSKKFVSQQIQANKKPVNTLEESQEIIVKETSKTGQNKPTLKGPIIQKYQKYVGTPAKNLIFNNPGESLGFVVGYNAYGDENSSYMEKLTAGLVLAGSIRGAKSIKYGVNGRVGDAVGRLIISDYGLSADYIKARQKFRANKNEIGARFLDIMERAQKDLNPEQNQLLYNFMIGDLAKMDELSPQALKINNEARGLLIKYGQELSDAGLLPDNIFKKNIDTYLKRSYRKESDVADKNIIALNNRQIKIIGDELRPRGQIEIVQKTSYNNPQSVWQREGWEVLEELKGGKVKVRRDYTKAERQQMGEIEDASYAIAETGRLLANDIATAKFFKELSENKNLVVDKAEYDALLPELQAKFVLLSDDTIQGTGKKRFGELAGKYVDQDVARDIKHIYNYSVLQEKGGLYKVSSDVGRVANQFQDFWKKTKTAWNLATHVGNSTSNVMLLDFSDTEFKYLLRAIKEMRSKSALNRQAEIDGIFDADLISKEFKDSMSEIERALAKYDPENQAVGVFEKTKAFAKLAKKYSIDKMERAYQLEDQVFRMAVYMDRLDKGFSQADAALEARKWFIDYDINAPAIKFLKRTFVPFISYTYRVIPLLAEAATLRPHKFAKWAVIGHGLNQGFSYMTDGTDTQEKLDRLTMRPEQNKRLFGSTPIIGDYMPYTTIRIPANDKDGNALYWDYARWVPGGDIFEQRESKVQVPGVPSPLQPGGLWWDALSNFVFKVDPFTGEDLANLGVDEEDFEDIAKHFAGRIPPNFFAIPGTFANQKWRKAKAIERGEEGSEYVKETTPWLAIAYGLGLKLRPQNPDINRDLREMLFQKEIAALEAKQNKLYKDAEKFGMEFFGSQKDFDKKDQALEEELIRVNAEYELWQEQVAELDLQLSKEYKGREKKVKGGLVEGKDEVPFTKEDPADRINKFTGEPYQEQMNRLGFKDAGKVERPKITPIEKTGETSRVGRPIWKGKLGDKEIFYSERTVTFPLNKEGTQWVTFPNINEQGLEIGEDRLRQYVLDKGPVDPITGEKFPVFNTEKEASLYASERSPSLRVQKNQGGVLDLIRLKRGDEVADALKNYGGKVAEIESNNMPTRIQDIELDNGEIIADGPARGKYQYEMFYRGGSGAAKTAVNSTINLYKKYNKKVPDELYKLSLQEDVDFSKLPESLQDDIFYASSAQKKGFLLDDLASGKLSEKDAWLNYHWAGKEEDRKSKSDLWDKRFVKEVVDNLQN